MHFRFHGESCLLRWHNAPEDGGPLCGGTAKYTTKALTNGTHTITATYNGSTSFGSSASLTQTVN